MNRVGTAAGVLQHMLGTFIGLLSSAAGFAGPLDTAGLDADIETMLKTWDQPGLAMALVENGKIVHERGFGVRNVTTGNPVDAQTLFGIASCSKSFASATIARLVADGRLTWDDPVTKRLPWFRLSREHDTDEVTLRDLLTMRTGIASSEYTFRRVSANRVDQVRRMRFLQQLHPLRSEYLYTTDTYTAIGEVVAEATAQPWEAFAAAAFWAPLGMTRTGADYRSARLDPNSAAPHLTVDGRKQPIPWIYEDYNALPAGGVNSTAHDLARWLLFELDASTPESKRLLPAALLHETQVPQTPMRGPYAQSDWIDVAGDGPDQIRDPSYAMGWFVHEYRGHQILWHSGSIDGFRCQLGFLSDSGFGIVALSNADESLFPLAVFQTAIDYHLGLGASRHWSERFLARSREQRVQREASARAIADARIPNTHPSLPLKAYIGNFADNGAFGDCRLTAEHDRLVMACGRMIYDLEHWHYDVFKARPRWPYEMEERNFFVIFQIDELAQMNSFHFDTGSEFRRLDTMRDTKTAP
jgi:CubicO group peptidase (beta-lactamase class C family)